MNFIFFLIIILVSHLSYASEIDFLSRISTDNYITFQRQYLDNNGFRCKNSIKGLNNPSSISKVICHRTDLHIIFSNFFDYSKTNTVEIIFEKNNKEQISKDVINKLFKINLVKTKQYLFEYSDKKNNFIYTDKEPKKLIIKDNHPKKSKNFISTISVDALL